MTWKQAVKKELQERGMPQKELAAMLGISGRELNRWLSTRKKIPAANVLKMARIFGWTQRQFFTYICPGALELPEDDDE